MSELREIMFVTSTCDEATLITEAILLYAHVSGIHVKSLVTTEEYTVNNREIIVKFNI